MTTYIIQDSDGNITASANWHFPGSESTDKNIVRGHDGKLYFFGEESKQTLEEVKAAKFAELNAVFTTASETAHCMSSFGFEINADEVANRNIEGLALVLEPGESTLFRSYDNSFHEVTKEQLETMRKEIVVNSQYLYRIKWQVEAAIDTAQTVDELNAIDITFETTCTEEGEDDEPTS